MQTRKALKSLSDGEIQYDRVTPNGPLAQNASWLLRHHASNEQRIAAAQERHQIAASLPILEVARQKLLQIIGERVLPDDTPIAMRFDVFNAVKQASKQYQKDIGLKRFSTHLERLWHEEPLGTISAGALTRLRDHYQSQNPRSSVGNIVDTVVPKVSFNNLPVAKLARIATEIDSQEDYDTAIIRHGLHRDNVHCIRARTFIRELVARKSAVLNAGQQAIEDNTSIGIARRAPIGVAADRVINRLQREAQEAPTDVEADTDTESANDPEKEGMGIDGTGVLSVQACLQEQEEMFRWAAETGSGIPKEAVAPPGWEHTVKELKKEKDIDNPWALAWWMEGKGYTPGGSDKKSEEDECATEIPKAAVAPPGWESTVKKMKKHKEIENPFALAWHMKEKGAHPGGSDKKSEECPSEKKAQTPYGQPWSAENMVELANDIMSEISNPQVMQLANKIVESFANSQQMQMPQSGSKQYGELLAYALQANPRAANKLKDIIYRSIMKETEEEMVSQPSSIAPEMAQQQPALVPTTANRTAKDKGKSQSEFEPQINQQQPPAVKHKPSDGLKVLKAFVLKADHPLVDDGQDHYPVFSEMAAKITLEKLAEQTKVPSWWLGSLDELKHTIEAAIKQAGDLPPEFLKNIKKKKDEGEEKEEKEAALSNPMEKAAMRGFSAEVVEEKLVNGQNVIFSDFSLHIASTEKGGEIIQLDTKQGYKQYQLFDMDSAISEFMYLVGTEKMTDSPAPVFYIREGMRLPCPGCGNINSFEMPKEAMDLGCNDCQCVLPSNVVEAAFESGAAMEETTLVAVTPFSLQEEFGEKFAKAAEIMGADSIGAEGCKAEAYTVAPDDKKMADVWDFLVEAGFKPIAQIAPMGAPPAAPSGDIMGQEAPPLDLTEPPGGEMPVDEGAMPSEADVPDLGEPIEELGYADHQMIQAAMMHYQAQGNSVIEAITQFNKDYGDGYDPETVMQVAATVYGIGLDQIKIGMVKGAGDLPSTSVNMQQPDAVSVGTGSGVLGPDSETKGDIKTPGKPKTQVKPQGTFADTSTEADSDNRDPGDYGAGKPKAQHPATDQQGVSLPETGLGSDSETEMGKLMKDFDSRSKAAPQSMQSK